MPIIIKKLFNGGTMMRHCYNSPLFVVLSLLSSSIQFLLLPLRSLLLQLLLVVVVVVIVQFPSSQAQLTTTNPFVQIEEDYYTILRPDRSGAVIHDMLMAHAYIYMKQNEIVEHNNNIDQEEHVEQQQQQNDDGGRKKRVVPMDPMVANAIKQQATQTIHLSSSSTSSTSSTSTKQKVYIVRGNIIDTKRRPNIHYRGTCPQKGMNDTSGTHGGTKIKTTLALLYDLGLEKALPIQCPDDDTNDTTATTNKYSPSKTTIVFLHANTYRVYDSLLFTNDWLLYLQSQMRKSTTTTDASSTTNNNNKKKKLRMVVHIRRGDVHPCNHPERYLSDGHYVRLIEEHLPSSKSNNNNNNNINNKNNKEMEMGTEMEVIIYSESNKYVSFDTFRKQNYTLQLNTPLNETWKAMIDADILIISKSSFSYVPALFNPNKVIYTPFWHEQPPNLHHWVTVSDALVQMAEQELHTIRTDLKCETK